jgi:IS30 family transposase
MNSRVTVYATASRACESRAWPAIPSHAGNARRRSVLTPYLRATSRAQRRRLAVTRKEGGCLRRQFPDQPEMWVSTETIYQSLYVQSRGALNRELTKYLRTGRALRKPGRATGQRKNRIPDMVNIAERPAEADDRAVPGHWEGDLVIGKRTPPRSARSSSARPASRCSSRCPTATSPSTSRPLSPKKIQTLPDALRRSLTWDQGPEMRDWKQVRIDAGIDVYFCDPHAPWQRGSNENTNGLLRQYFPKGTDFSSVTEGPARRRRRRAQRPTPQAPRLRQADRRDLRAAVAITARIRRSLRHGLRRRSASCPTAVADDVAWRADNPPPKDRAFSPRRAACVGTRIGTGCWCRGTA